MSVPPERFDRAEGRVNVSLLRTKCVVVVGVGAVGSQIAEQLANTGVGCLRFIDYDVLEEANLLRHTLTRAYLGMNKAEGMTLYLADEIPTLRLEAVPRRVDESLSDDQLDQLLCDADLIVAATGDHEVQRRVGRRALALDVPAILPGLHEHQGGEVFVQRSPRLPCYLCWDGHREITQPLRGVAATNPDILAIIQLAAWLSFAILDPRSQYARRLLTAEPGQASVPQIFTQNDLTLAREPAQWRENCPSCAVGPASDRQASVGIATISSHLGRSPSAGVSAYRATPTDIAPALWWWLKLIGGISIGASLIGTFFAAPVTTPGTSGNYGQGLVFLLHVCAITSVPALVAAWTAEWLASRSTPPTFANYDEGHYRIVVVAAAVIPAFLLVSTHLDSFPRGNGSGPENLPSWWWVICPALMCVAHTAFLTVERWKTLGAVERLIIPLTTACSFGLCVAIFGLPSLPVH